MKTVELDEVEANYVLALVVEAKSNIRNNDELSDEEFDEHWRAYTSLEKKLKSFLRDW